MASETIEGTFRQTNLPNESAEYLAKREDLRLAEIELMNQKERVSEMRRHLPPMREGGLDLLNPIWNFLDLTPKGREDFVAKLQYPEQSRTEGR